MLAVSLVVVALIGGALGTTLGLVRAVAEAEEKEKARQVAVAKEAKATAISDLLREMFGSANPDEFKGTEYTVRQLLDDASGRLGDQLKDQPEAEAAIRATIGNAYRRLGFPDKAEPHLQAALELVRRVYGAEHEQVAESLVDLARNCLERSRSAPTVEAWSWTTPRTRTALPKSSSTARTAPRMGTAGTVAATFTVTLSHPSRERLTVDYATGSDTAGAGSDFQAAFGQVVLLRDFACAIVAHYEPSA